jgi:L-alanine-DL-glutamate epimerase-like enolase superfamily enzyme
MLRALDEFEIDFVEQPVRDHPIGLLAELRGRTAITVCANEGLWSTAEAYARVRARQADVFCFSQYWVGSILAFRRLAWVAECEGLQVCKHTHGELGLAAAAAHHVVLTIPNGVAGHQQTAYMLEHDILARPLPIASGPRWGTIDGPGLGVDVDENAVADAAARYRSEGQYRPWDVEQLAKEER